MGNIGGIEKIMVFGVLVIIVTLLGIAFYSATQIDDEIVPNDLDSNIAKASGREGMVSIFDSEPAGAASESDNKGGLGKVLFEDVITGKPAGTGAREPLKNNVPSHEADNRNEDGTAEEAVLIEKPAKEEENADSKPVEWMTEYKVKKSDSFMKIARVLYGDVKRFKEIQDANPDVDPCSLQIGQVIKLPEPVSLDGSGVKKSATGSSAAARSSETGRTYEVKSGDTLAGISKEFYGDALRWRKIYDSNRDVIANPDVLQLGTVLLIPEKD